MLPVTFSPSPAVTMPTGFLPPGRFVFKRRLGQGGFGEVFEVLDTACETPMALKLLRLTDTDALYRFKQEFRLLTDIVHPNLVTLHELFSNGKDWFFTMEYVAGGDIVTWLSAMDWRTAREGEKRLRRALFELASGLDTLHRAGVAHLDIKPENVLVRSDESVALVDFGLAMPLRAARPDASMRNDATGTPRYMAPEQWSGAPLTEATDWYAFGIVMHECLTGRHPFHEPGGPLILWAHDLPTPHLDALSTSTVRDLASLCARLLAAEPGSRPGADEIIERLRGATDSVRALPPMTTTQRLFGRDRELEALRSALGRCARGEFTCIRISGPSGIGKSALLKAWVHEVHAAGSARVLYGRCGQSETVPFKLLDGILDGMSLLLAADRPDVTKTVPESGGLLALAHHFPVIGDALGVDRIGPQNVGSDHSELIRGLGDALHILTRRSALVLAIDDFQWADLDSVRLLGACLTLAAVPPIMLVISHRDQGTALHEPIDVLLTLLGSARPRFVPHEMALQPLSASPSRALITAVAPSAELDDARCARILDESAGYPLLIEELARHEMESDAGPVDRASSLDGAIGARIARLPAAARDLLGVLVLARGPVPQSVVLRVAGGRASSLTCLSILRANSLLRTAASGAGTEIEISHDRIRKSVEANIAIESPVDIHRRLAQELQALENPPVARVAMHTFEGGDAALAIDLALRGADQARTSHAYSHAADLLGLALDWSRALPTPPRPVGELIATRCDMLVRSGRSAEAAELFLARSLAADGLDRLELERQALEHFLIAGRLDEGLALVRPVLARVGLRYPDSPRSALASLLYLLMRLKLRPLDFETRDVARVPLEQLLEIDTCWGLGKALTDVKPLQGTAFQIRSLLVALRAGDPERVARAMLAFGGMWSWQGSARALRTGHTYIERGCRIAAQSGRPKVIGLGEIVRGARLMTLGAWDDALASVDRGAELLEEDDHVPLWESNMARVVAMLVLEATHRFVELLDRGRRWHRQAVERGDVFSRVTSFTCGALGLVGTGTPDQMRAGVVDALATWPLKESVQDLSLVPSEVYADLYQGEPDVALSRLDAAWPRIQANQLLRASIMRMKLHTLGAQVALACAGTTPATRQALLTRAERSVRQVAKEVRSDAKPISTMLRAAIVWQRGDHLGAATGLGSAESEFTAIGMSVHAACCRRRRGELLGGTAGAELVKSADAALSHVGIVSPERWSSCVVPGPPAIHS